MLELQILELVQFHMPKLSFPKFASIKFLLEPFRRYIKFNRTIFFIVVSFFPNIILSYASLHVFFLYGNKLYKVVVYVI